MEIEREIQALKERKHRVQLDKVWEQRWTRRLFIALITYIVAVLWLYIIKENDCLLKSIIPVAGYLLSTLSLPVLRKFWIRCR